MKAWAGEELLISNVNMCLFSLYGFLLFAGDVRGAYSDSAGLWWHTRIYTVIEALLNIILNVLLGYYFGIGGIVSASIVSVIFCNYFYGPYILFKHYFNKNGFKKYILTSFRDICCFSLHAFFHFQYAIIF